MAATPESRGHSKRWSGRGESNSRFLLGREACHRNTTAARFITPPLSSAAGAPAAHEHLLGKIMPAPLNLFEPQNGCFGPSWPSVSKTLGPLSPE
jgi:hypothetical protein